MIWFVFCLLFTCLLLTSFTGCYCWLNDAGSCIQVVSFVWVLTIWYSLRLVLWLSRVLESVFPFRRLRAWSLDDSGSGSLMRLQWNWLELQPSKGLTWAAEHNCRQSTDTKYYEESEHAGFQLFHLTMMFLGNIWPRCWAESSAKDVGPGDQRC